jgi:DNA-binding MarR family transcriptional regulator
MTISRNCLCHKARLAGRVLTRFYERYFAGSGIEPTQFNLLVGIRLGEPVSVQQLAAGLGLERTTLTRNLGVLRRKGIVEIGRGKDERMRLLSLTPLGRRLLKRALPHWERAQEAAVSALGADNSQRFSNALWAINELNPVEGD